MSHTVSDVTEESTYRWTQVRQLCSVCNGVTAGDGCPRCAAPLCEQHGAGAQRRCASCEAQFERLVRDRRANPVPLAPMLVIYGCTCAFSLGMVATTSFWHRFPLLTGVLLAALVAVGPLLAALHRRRRLRPLFLAELPQHRRLRYHVPPAQERSAKASSAARPARPVAVVGLVLSLCGWFIPGFPLIALVLGAVALRTPCPEDFAPARDMALAALVVGAATSLLHLSILLRVLAI